MIPDRVIDAVIGTILDADVEFNIQGDNELQEWYFINKKLYWKLVEERKKKVIEEQGILPTNFYSIGVRDIAQIAIRNEEIRLVKKLIKILLNEMCSYQELDNEVDRNAG